MFDIILASTSPRRQELMKKIPWLTAAVFPPICTEDFLLTLTPEQAAVTLAARKAQCVFDVTGKVVVGADTMVVKNNQIFNKPTDAAHAEQMFRQLCGGTHYVVTGVCVLSQNKKVEFFEKTFVTFGAFNDKIVYNYIKSGLCFGKAGAYGIQDMQLEPLVKDVCGCLDNVIGLPVAALSKTLKEFF